MSSEVVVVAIGIFAVGEGTSAFEETAVWMPSQLFMHPTKFFNGQLQLILDAVQGTVAAGLPAVATTEKDSISI